MEKLARRMTIFTLSMAVFALFVAELVTATNNGTSRRALVGGTAACSATANPLCVAAL